MRCSNCGVDNLQIARFCQNCGTQLELDSQDVELASLGRRIVAYLIDMIIVIVVAGFCMVPVYSLQDAQAIDEVSVELYAYLIYFFVFFGYFTVFEGPLGKGRTLGKMLLKLRVIKEKNQERIGIGTSFVRNLLRLIDGIFFYLVGILLISDSDLNQRLGDKAAHTLVIKETPIKDSEKQKHIEKSKDVKEKPNNIHESKKQEGAIIPGYLVCNSCRGHYALQENESADDFSDECECGGKLKYYDDIDW